MITALIQRHHAHRRFARLLGIALGTVGLVNGLWLFLGLWEIDPAKGAAGEAIWPATASVVLALVPFFMYAALSPRYSEHDLTLPIPARSLWQAHVATLLIEGAVMLAVVLGLSWALEALRIADLPESHSSTLLHLDRLLAHTTAAVILGVALAGSPRSSSMRLASGRGGGRWIFVLVVAYLAAMSWFSMFPAWLALLPAGAACVLYARTYRRFPAAIDWMPPRMGGPVRTRAGSPHAGLPRSRHPRTVLRLTIWRALNHQYLVWLIYIILAAMTFFLAGGGAILDETGDTRFTTVTLLIYMLVLVLPMSMKKLALIDALPVPRARILAYLILPPAAVLAAAYLATFVATQVTHELHEAITYRADDTENPLKMPLGAFAIDVDGEVAPITAPWGETHAAFALPIIEGLPPVLYKPFTAPASCSREFLAWQIRRAAETLYGLDIPPEKIAARYFEASGTNGQIPGTDGRPLGTGTLSIAEDYGAAERPLRERLLPLFYDPDAASVFPCVATVIAVAWFLASAWMCRFYRASYSKRRRSVFVFGTVAAVFLVHLLQFVLDGAGVWNLPVVAAAFVLGARSLAGAVPGGTYGLYVLGTALAWISYRILRREYERIEVPALEKPLRPVLGDWIPR